MREFFKFAKAFSLTALVMGIPFFVGLQIGSNNSSLALQGCEVVASQSLKDRQADAEEYYKDLQDLQTKMKACDDLMDDLQNLDLTIPEN